MEFLLPRFFSSYEFYNLIDRIDRSNDEMVCNSPIVLDMTEVYRIDGNVIPNLILLGKWLEERTGHIPSVRFGRTFEAGYLKKYLLGIGFYEQISNVYNLDDPEYKYAGLDGKSMDKKNKTWHIAFPYSEIPLERQYSEKDFDRLLLYDERVKRDLLSEIHPFLEAYLAHFEYGDTQDRENRIADIITQMVSNSLVNGYSECYLTLQANYKRKVILIAVSDRGIGMKSSINSDIRFEKEKGFRCFDRDVFDELEAIMQAIYYRKNSKVYGIFNAIVDIVQMNGIVRIHSNDTQVIIHSKIKEKLLGENIHDFLCDNCIDHRSTVEFPGVHIEIEIPLE